VVIYLLLNALDTIIIHEYVNDDTAVSVWQDGIVTEPQPAGVTEPVANRAIDDVESLRAMADPTRLAILNALMHPQQGELPVLSAKDLAARLGESQTKLYRHIRQLETAGLIRVAATRMVSGIQEQRYQASQHDLSFGDGFLREHADESEAMMRAVLASFRDGFFTAERDLEIEAFRRRKMYHGSATVSHAKAAEIRQRIDEFVDWLADSVTEERHGIRVNVLLGYYADPGKD
jgi:DNA-binding transcriptional ArsR family regulator